MILGAIVQGLPKLHCNGLVAIWSHIGESVFPQNSSAELFMKMHLIATGLIGVALTTGAEAQQALPPTSFTAILACREQSNAEARLRCYDSAAASLAEASASGKISVLDREEVRKTRRSLFGFNIPSIPFFRGDVEKESEPDQIEARLKSARATGYNKWLVELEGGALWQTTEPDTRGSTPKAGQLARIKKGAIGSYMISFEGSRALRAMRVR
jgi:hypothetical protein